MADPRPLQKRFRGIHRDKSRDDLPPDYVWNLENYIPEEFGAPLRKRGGYGYFGATLNSLDASALQPDRVAFAPFTTGLQVVAIDSLPQGLFDLTNGADRGAVNKPVGPMIFYRDKLIIPCNTAGAAPQKYTGSGAPATLTGAPDFSFATVYKDRLAVISQGSSTRNTIKRVKGDSSDASNATFTLTFQGQTTGSIDADASAATITTALEALSNIAPGDVVVISSGAVVGPLYRTNFTVEFAGAYATLNVELSVTQVSGTWGVGAAALHVETVQTGLGFSTSPLIYFSGAANPESWDTTNRFMNTSSNLVALAALPNALLCFHSGTVERIRGSIPPGSAAANMELEPLFSDVGLIDNDAIAVADGYVCWADENGVYRSDGTAISDLTEQGGISSYWRDQVAQAAGSVALTVWRGYVWISLLDASDNYVDFLVCDIEKRAWFRFTNIKAYNFATQFGSTDELYFSNRDTTSKQIGALSGVFLPTASNKNDADGDAVTPVLETGFYSFDTLGKKRVRYIYVAHDTRDAASDDPTQTVSYLTDPASSSYTALSPTLTETTRRTRSRVPVRTKEYGVAFKIAQTNASSDSRLYSLEAEAHALEGSRR